MELSPDSSISDITNNLVKLFGKQTLSVGPDTLSFSFLRHCEMKSFGPLGWAKAKAMVTTSSSLVTGLRHSGLSGTINQGLVTGMWVSCFTKASITLLNKSDSFCSAFTGGILTRENNSSSCCGSAVTDETSWCQSSQKEKIPPAARTSGLH